MEIEKLIPVKIRIDDRYSECCGNTENNKCPHIFRVVDSRIGNRDYCTLNGGDWELECLWEPYPADCLERTNYCKELFGVPEVKDGNH